MRALLGHHWRRHRAVLLVLAAGMALFEWVITRLAPEAEQAEAMRRFIALLPAPMTTLFSELLENVSAQGILAFGYAHPFPLLLMSLWTIRVSAGALAGEIGQGTMDLLAARPVSRARHVWVALLALLAGLVILTGAAWSGTALGLAGRRVADIPPRDFAPLAAMAGLLFAAFGGLALAVSAARRTAGEAIAVSAGLVAGSFVLDYVARLWAPIAPLRRLSLFAYFQPLVVLRSGIAAADVLVLLTVAVVGVGLAFVVFGRRDL